jgi:fructokinase
MNRSARNCDGPVVVGIGEALFDCFSDRLILGGAPVNFTVHVHRLLSASGGRGLLVSRVGDDRLGERLLGELTSRGIPTNLIQRDPIHRTGQVKVRLSSGGHPDYDIAENVAWDHLAFEDSLQLLATTCDAVCFGTLAQRHQTSRATIQRFLQHATNALRVLDINLRQHYFTIELLDTSLKLANVVKLNLEELEHVSDMLSDSLKRYRTPNDQARGLVDAFQLQLLALTRGKDGTVLYTADQIVAAEPVSIDRSPGADSVGAGDASCAGIIYGLLMNWPLARTLELANRLGAFVASQPGATPQVPTDFLNALVA